MTPKAWAYDTGVRAVKTFAQSLVAVFAMDTVTIINVDWKTALALGGTAGLVSILQNVQTFPTPKDGQA